MISATRLQTEIDNDTTKMNVKEINKHHLIVCWHSTEVSLLSASVVRDRSNIPLTEHPQQKTTIKRVFLYSILLEYRNGRRL